MAGDVGRSDVPGDDTAHDEGTEHRGNIGVVLWRLLRVASSCFELNQSGPKTLPTALPALHNEMTRDLRDESTFAARILYHSSRSWCTNPSHTSSSWNATDGATSGSSSTSTHFGVASLYRRRASAAQASILEYTLIISSVTSPQPKIKAI